LIRKDAFSKVTGQAKYVDDLRLPGTLYVQAVRCPHPHARIMKIDADKAKAASGVVCVLTAADVRGVLAGPNDKPVLAADEAKHPGEGVALVVAETRAKAVAAAKLVRIEYESLASVHTIEESLAEEAPLVHKDGNIAFTHLIEKGDIDFGFAMADLIIEREYNTQRAMHGAIEPDGALVVPENKGLVVYCPGKDPFATRKAVAKACGLSENEVRLIQPATGGAFGGKFVDVNLIASRLAVAALYTGRPCKTTWSREEVLEEGSKRHPFTLKYRAGVRKDGKICAMDILGYADAGAYITSSRGVVWRAAVEAAGPYNIENVRVRMHAVFTNNVCSDGVRGFGSPQVDFASESLINELAEILGMSPLEFRRKNILRDGNKTATSQTLEEVNLSECLDKLEEVFHPDEKPASSQGKLCGRGMSCIFRGEARGAAAGSEDGSIVEINLNRDGGVDISCGIAEMGQGGYNAVMQIVSGALGVPIEDVRMVSFDTDHVPDGGPTTGSRGTITFGNAAFAACKDLVCKMKLAVSAAKGVSPEKLELIDGVFCTAAGDTKISFKEAAIICRGHTAGLSGRAYWSLPETNWDFENNKGYTYSSYNYAACGADVEVDSATGKVKLLGLVAVHDVGRIINEEEIKGQITGGACMALGLSLMEDVPIEDGLPTVHNFDGYHIPSAKDIGNIQAIPLTPRPGANPLGVKGIGEPSTAVAAPAIISAINNALGIKIRSLPATPEKILKAMEGRQ